MNVRIRRVLQSRRGAASLAVAVTLLAVALTVGAVVMVTVFGAGASAASLNVDLDQCANQATPCDWQNGNLNRNNSTYQEGEVVPFRLAIEGLTPGQHTIHINYDFTAGGHKAYAFLATYDATETVKLCAVGGGAVSSLCPSLPSPTTFPFPTDPFPADGLTVSGAEAFSGLLTRDLTIFGGTIVGISVPTHDGPLDGNSTGDIIVSFKSADSAVLFTWGAQLAQSDYWDVDIGGDPDGANVISGAPWHMRTQQLASNGGGNRNQDRSIQPSALVEDGPTPTPTVTPTPDPKACVPTYDPGWVPCTPTPVPAP